MTGIGYMGGTNPGDDVIYAGTGSDFVNAGLMAKYLKLHVISTGVRNLSCILNA